MDMIRQVGAAIGELAKHMSTSADVANAIAAVSARAKGIAFKAWQVIAGGQAPERAAEELVADLTRLAEEMAGLATRAGQEAVVSHKAASVLVMAANEFAAVANDSQAVCDITKLRARLRPLVGQLETIPQRLVEGKVIAEAFAQSARAAATLAARGRTLREAGKPGLVLQSLYDGVSSLADQTGSLSIWITANAEHTQRAAAMIASTVEQVSRPPPATQPAAKTEDLSAIVSRGGAIVW